MGWQSWIRTVEIVPAIPANKAAALERSVEALLRTGCRIIHLNALDGDAQRALATLAPMVHRYDGILDLHVGGAAFDELALVGADNVTFDLSAVADVRSAIDELHAADVQVGIAVPSGFAPEEVAAAAEGADLVLCECVDPGDTVRLRRLAALLPDAVAIQVEGDVTHDTVRSLYDAGARLLVVDEPIFVREDLPRAYRRLVQALA